MKKQYLDVAYEDKQLAKQLGAKWDPSVKRWFCSSGSTISKIFTWRKPIMDRNSEPNSTLAPTRNRESNQFTFFA